MGIKILATTLLIPLLLMCAGGAPDNTPDREAKQIFMVLIFGIVGLGFIWFGGL